MSNLNSKLNELENRINIKPKAPMIGIFQDWDDPNQWHPGQRDAEPMTWDEAEKKYSDHVIFWVTHVDNWRT